VFVHSAFPRTEAFDVRDSSTTPWVLFPELCDRPVIARFDVPNASSDGGAVLLKAAELRLDLIPRLAAAADRAPQRRSARLKLTVSSPPTILAEAAWAQPSPSVAFNPTQP